MSILHASGPTPASPVPTTQVAPPHDPLNQRHNRIRAVGAIADMGQGLDFTVLWILLSCLRCPLPVGVKVTQAFVSRYFRSTLLEKIWRIPFAERSFCLHTRSLNKGCFVAVLPRARGYAIIQCILALSSSRISCLHTDNILVVNDGEIKRKRFAVVCV